MTVPSLCYVTPSFAPDIERFALLRRSLALFSPDIPHIAYVDTEDCAQFRDRFGQERNLEIVPTAELLPAAVEAERRFWRSWRGRVAERIGWRLKLGARPFTGWKLQQVIKLEAICRLPHDAAVFLDSDLVLCGRMEAADFFADGRLRLLETPAASYEDFAFEIARQILVGAPLLEPARAFNYIHQAPRFLTRTGQALRRHLDSRHTDWRVRFFRESFPSEYDLLGWATRVLEGYVGYHVEDTPPESWVYNVKTMDALDAQLAECRAEGGHRKFILVQSNLRMPVAEYLPRVQALIEDLAAPR
ncbi:DUF6492 family protein [Falsiroseomonas oryzae]|uniref:DUF6492 family protein n=1 Tax=Falsiroseomonas oryzae TaxID=2766473 RepID=UPI0022EA51E4|nr:DUF6492 family protein [Roseomonas sp. MO-31]